ncbi:MAG TPA: hypothetical protein ACFYED_02680 [Candidatus Tripitaka californicus]|uniref:hypothetical protein n=1 Tax=Candidatus Tripitaka californicus TaxID=3367616 RepID=UPI0040298D52|nr:hypothetical protein [Planctomycetota bacterium]
MKSAKIFLVGEGSPRLFVLWVTIFLITVIHCTTQGPSYAEEKGTVILIRCADPRINDACTGLLDPDEHPAIISNTGSIKYFLVGDRLPDLYGQIRLLVHKFGVKKLIITNHTHCGFYKELALGEEAELSDLRAVKRKLLKDFPEVEIRGYLIDTEASVSTPVE